MAEDSFKSLPANQFDFEIHLLEYVVENMGAGCRKQKFDLVEICSLQSVF